MLYNISRSIAMNFGFFLFHNSMIVSKFETFTQIRRSSFEREKRVRVLASVCPCVYLSVSLTLCLYVTQIRPNASANFHDLKVPCAKTK